MAIPPDMQPSAPTRELAAIMFSDIAGYTAIMGRDEADGLNARNAHRDLLRTILPRFNGRLLGDLGDGALSSFHSAIDAVNCARAFQAAAGNDSRFSVRIGIHVGDVVFSDNTVLGDGVNVASRLVALAAPGGSCISERVYEEIRNKPEFQVKDLGEQKLKNVARPIRVYALAAPGAPVNRRAPSASAADEPTLGRRRRAIVAGIVALLVAAASVYEIESRGLLTPGSVGTTAIKAGAIRSIAVLPLENLSGDPAQEYFADGMTDELITDLAKISGLRVISRTSVMQFKGEHRERLPEIARTLKVDTIVEGSVLRVGDKVRITAQLIDAPTDKHLWAESYERDTRDVLAIQDEIAAAIAHEIDIELTPQEKARLAQTRAVNPEALDACLKGRYFLIKGTSEGYQKAREYYEQAIKIAPDFAGGYVGMAAWYVVVADAIISGREAIAKAREPLETALRLDDKSSQAHTALAFLEWSYEYNWVAAEKEYIRAIELGPADADAHNGYGMMLSVQGRFDEAERELKLAQQLDPLSPDKPLVLGWLFNFRGEYPKAIEQFRKALELDPNFWLAQMHMGISYDWMGDHARAIKEFEKAEALDPGVQPTAFLGLAYAKAGNSEQARKVLEQLNRPSGQTYVSPAFPAFIYAALGDKKTALDLLEKAYQERSQVLCFMKVDRDFDPLRSEPRFIELLKKVGLDK